MDLEKYMRKGNLDKSRIKFKIKGETINSKKINYFGLGFKGSVGGFRP